MNNQVYKFNNFDLLRLAAALQVVANHTIEELQIHQSVILSKMLHFSQLFPGVPIFFFISGFLISKSYESNHRLGEYAQNRMLRLYPGLVICVSVSFIFIYLSGYMATTNAGIFDWGLLYLAKTTVVQFYNPDFMRAYGDGVLNGSLWTITVEIQFYILVPIIYTLFNLKNAAHTNLIIVTLILLFLLVNRAYANIPFEYHDTASYKLLRISFLPWFYMFLFGIFAQKNFSLLHKLLANNFVPIFVVYCLTAYIASSYKLSFSNNISPVFFVPLAITAFSFAYSFSGISKKLLRGNDISYGTYIYHMPVVNVMLYTGFHGSLSSALCAFLITIILALASWLLIEKKSLSLKRHPFNPLNRENTKQLD